MKFTSTTKTIIEWPLVNTLLGIIGLAIVWLSTHSWVAILGAFIAAIHVQIRVNKK